MSFSRGSTIRPHPQLEDLCYVCATGTVMTGPHATGDPAWAVGGCWWTTSLEHPFAAQSLEACVRAVRTSQMTLASKLAPPGMAACKSVAGTLLGILLHFYHDITIGNYSTNVFIVGPRGLQLKRGAGYLLLCLPVSLAAGRGLQFLGSVLGSAIYFSKQRVHAAFFIQRCEMQIYLYTHRIRTHIYIYIHTRTHIYIYIHI